TPVSYISYGPDPHLLPTPPPPHTHTHTHTLPGYGQPYPGQPYPSQLYPGQSELGQPYPGQPYPGQPYPGQLYAGQPVAVSVQPTVYVPQGPLENPVNDYLCYSIFTMVCCSCCLPLGIAALIYSITVSPSTVQTSTKEEWRLLDSPTPPTPPPPHLLLLVLLCSLSHPWRS
uniref:Si:dkey-33i11.9 n=1 Tax=Sphaeramia orbicularis TaxID=375764 RepID=A0A672ZWJ7_9TELE